MNNQHLAFEQFKKLKVGALFMQMGTGKTKVAIELVDFNKCDLLVYIAPFSTLNNIENEFKKWNLKTNYILIGYETISSSDTKYLKLLKELENKKVFVVADESIFIKNEETKRFKRLLSIRSMCEYALILNGTPITKNEWDLYNQMYFLSPLIINMNREQFLNTFFKKITYKKSGQKENTFYKFSEINAEYLQRLIAPYTFKCDLEFDNREKEEYIYVDYENDDTYYWAKEQRLKEYMQLRKSETIINLLSDLTYISATYNEKNDEMINYIKNKQIIVYCTFLDEIKYIRDKIDCYAITGSTKYRREVINKFKNDNKPLLMTYGVGAYSLNLQFCNEIVYSSINFDYAKLEQSKYRIKRIGQDRDIKYTYFLTDLGINKLILENLKRKMTLENLIKEKMKEGSLEWLKSI